MKSKMRKIRRYWPLYLMMLPACIYIFINNYVPLPGVSLASKDAWIIMRNTIGYNLIFIVLGTVCAIAVAILLCEIRSKISKKIYQTCILIPYLVSMVIVSYLVFAFLSEGNGYINTQILAKLGMNKISWYNEPKYWPVILVIVNECGKNHVF